MIILLYIIIISYRFSLYYIWLAAVKAHHSLLQQAPRLRLQLPELLNRSPQLRRRLLGRRCVGSRPLRHLWQRLSERDPQILQQALQPGDTLCSCGLARLRVLLPQRRECWRRAGGLFPCLRCCGLLYGAREGGCWPARAPCMRNSFTSGNRLSKSFGLTAMQEAFSSRACNATGDAASWLEAV